jgi:hypothetical protein
MITGKLVLISFRVGIFSSVHVTPGSNMAVRIESLYLCLFLRVSGWEECPGSEWSPENAYDPKGLPMGSSGPG